MLTVAMSSVILINAVATTFVVFRQILRVWNEHVSKHLKGWSLPGCYTQGQAPGFICKYETWLEWLVRDNTQTYLAEQSKAMKRKVL